MSADDYILQKKDQTLKNILPLIDALIQYVKQHALQSVVRDSSLDS